MVARGAEAQPASASPNVAPMAPRHKRMVVTLALLWFLSGQRMVTAAARRRETMRVSRHRGARKRFALLKL